MTFGTAFKDALTKRAKSVLKNPNEVTPEAVDVVTKEAQEECAGKEVKSWVVMDFSMIRLKIYLKIELKEEDVIMLKNALNEIKNSPLSGQSKPGGLIYEAV